METPGIKSRNDEKRPVNAEGCVEAANRIFRLLAQHLVIPAPMSNWQEDVIMRISASESCRTKASQKRQECQKSSLEVKTITVATPARVTWTTSACLSRLSNTPQPIRFRYSFSLEKRRFPEELGKFQGRNSDNKEMRFRPREQQTSSTRV